MTKVIHTRRDMDPGAIGLYFWEGQLLPDAPGVVESAEGVVDATSPPDKYAEPDHVSATPSMPTAARDAPSQGIGSEDPKLLECLQNTIGAKRTEELRTGTGPPPDQPERTAMGPCYQASQGVPPPSLTPVPFSAATSVPMPTSMPLPTSTSVTVAPTPSGNSGGGGCNASINRDGGLDAGWLLLGLTAPGLALRNLGQRKKKWGLSLTQGKNFLRRITE